MTMISDQLIAMKNYTTALEAQTDTLTGAASANLNQKDFLKLLTEQLQFQDPMEPTGNTEFISQMCQFSQLNVSTSMNDNIAEFTGEKQASSLVGQVVTLTDPNNNKNTITGVVQGAYLDGKDSGIAVNGTVYPLKYLLFSHGEPKTETTTNDTTTKDTTTETKTENSSNGGNG